MNTVPSPPARPNPAARPLLALDRDELRLSSPRGDAVSGAITLTNRGEAPLEGAVLARIGGEWLRIEPAVLHLAPGEARRVEVQADPAGLAPGYTRGELEIITSGGTAAIPVRLAVHVRRSWRLLALAVAAGIAVAATAALLLAGVQIPTGGPTAAPPGARASHHGVHRGQSPVSRPSFNRQAALADIRGAIDHSNTAWQTALMDPSTSALASSKTGRDLARDVADVGSLLAAGEHWQIDLQRFKVLSVHVSDDDRGGWGIVEKTERRALYGPDHMRVPYEISEATYRLRYHLVHEHGRWLVDDVTVQRVTPLVASGPPLTVQQAVERVLPAVIHVEADSPGQTAVGTGFVIHSSATASYIITNNHVVTGASTVKLQRWSTVRDAYVPTIPWIATQVREDPADDLAVVKIDQGNLPVAAWGNSDALQVTQPVVAIGYAENLAGGPTVTNGIVSSLLRTAPDNPNGPTYIQHSAPINHGNSGGPLLDMTGHVVGINTWTLDNTQGLFFAIPSSRAARVAAGFIGSNG